MIWFRLGLPSWPHHDAVMFVVISDDVERGSLGVA
jgi:hypothetical protein